MRRSYLQALYAARYEDIITNKTHIATNQFLRKFKIFQLCKRVLDVITWRMDETFDEENYDRSAGEVAIQAKNIESEQRATLPQERRADECNAITRKTSQTVKIKQFDAGRMDSEQHRDKADNDVSGKKEREMYMKRHCALIPYVERRTSEIT